MIPADFEYVAPTTLAEAVAALGEAGEDAKILAGGQSLIPVLRLRLAFPTTLVDLSKVAEPSRRSRQPASPWMARQTRSGVAGMSRCRTP